MSRIVCHFSCGAASAVATKLALTEYGQDRTIIYNAFIVEEHSDNRRFADDCERWFEHPITVLRNEKYGASTDEVWRRRRYIKGISGAPCSQELKGRLLDAVAQPADLHILGFTIEEQDRYDDFLDAHPLWISRAILIDKGLSKADCLAIIKRAGIELPVMYRLGFHNANCIGCPKGGSGYWNKIRQIFPDRFNQVAAIQEAIGPGAKFLRDRRTGERIWLRELNPEHGRIEDEPEISCSFFCVAAERTIANKEKVNA